VSTFVAAGLAGGPFRVKAMYEDADSAQDYVQAFNQRVAELVTSVDSTTVAAVIDVVAGAFNEGRTVYVMANGGSAAVASHFVNDMSVNALTPQRPGCRVLSLTDNVESITAIANDSGYEHIFEFQLQCLLTPGDVVIAMSVSGNSPNIVRGVEYANSHGATTIGFTGFDGGRLRDLAQVSVHIESTRDEYGPVEDVFSVLCHAVSGYITMSRGRFLHH
jgi:D-sedoheptulose 7-phosphate isomerase